jgi:uncharacterized protein with NAD-binding domain and iron-sulfur cluster
LLRNLPENISNGVHLYSITISNANRFNGMPSHQIIKIIEEEINKIFNDTINILAYKFINVKNGTSLITNENKHFRPFPKTEIKNFFLAGD